MAVRAKNGKEAGRSAGGVGAPTGGGDAKGAGEGQAMTLLTPKQAAERVGVSDSLVYEWCADGLLPHYRFGRKNRRGCIRIDANDLDAFMAAHRREATPAAPPLKHIRLGHG